jgi:hypothetical protein
MTYSGSLLAKQLDLPTPCENMASLAVIPEKLQGTHAGYCLLLLAQVGLDCLSHTMVTRGRFFSKILRDLHRGISITIGSCR